MGRTVPSWRNRLEKRIDYWRDFKRALRPGERDSLENLASAVRRRSSACGMLPLSDEFEPIVLVMLIDIDIRLSSLEAGKEDNDCRVATGCPSEKRFRPGHSMGEGG